MANIFKMAGMPKVPYNRFDLTHDVKMSFDFGELIPTCCIETLPGDIFEIEPETLLRLAPLVSPVMHNIIADTHFFFVPNRLAWPEWEEWITGDSDSEVPYTSGNQQDYDTGSLADYLGIPQCQNNDVKDEKISAFPAWAYAAIYDEYYRDQNIQDVATPTTGTLTAGNNYATGIHFRYREDPLVRCWNHDYFTACLPYPIKTATVTLPLTNSDDVLVHSYDGAGDRTDALWRLTSDGSLATGAVTGDASGVVQIAGSDGYLDPDGSLYVTPNNEAVDLVTLRRAFKLQEFLERDARGGTRYIENTYAQFGVKSSDGRYHRPEYIGGLKQQVVISEVLSHAETLNSGNAVTSALGELGGHGISVGAGNSFKFKAEEHGLIMGIISIRPRTAYQDGLHKMYHRFDRFDYAWPAFSHIGEQAVTVREIYYACDTAAELDETFGYIPRYSEYKFMNSRVAGDFKDTLEHWHCGRKFTSKPTLNPSFLTCDSSETDRIFASTTDDTVYAHIINKISALRKLPKFGNPKM